MMAMMLRPILGAVIGAAIGFAMYRFVGCKTGACPLTANPWVAMMLWGLIGALAAAGK
ncbi:MAG: DUF6132 family protein [Lentisphaerae bacterium]|nr:DUF6132 family protein [Lentisphaerota bacterium]